MRTLKKIEIENNKFKLENEKKIDKIHLKIYSNIYNKKYTKYTHER